MANTAINKSAKSSGQLPVPNLKLVHANNANQDPVAVPFLDNSGAVAGDYKLFRFPQVVATDLTPAQIEKGVRVEMAHYIRPQSRYNKKKGGGFVVPAPWIGGANPIDGDFVRGGGHFNTYGVAMPDRPNSYQVTAMNQVVPVHEYLANRHIIEATLYYDTAGNKQTVKTLNPVARRRTQNYAPGRTFMYSGRHTPYYFAFRYSFRNDDGTWTSGPYTKIVKLTHLDHPFQVDAQASALIGRQVGTVNPLFSETTMVCHLETRLP